MWARESDQTPVASCVWFGIVYTTTPILKTSYDYIGRKTQEEKKKYILFGAASTQIFEFFIFQQEIVLRPFFLLLFQLSASLTFLQANRKVRTAGLEYTE